MPLSGRQTQFGSVGTTRTTSGGGNSSVLSSTSSVDVQGSYAGSTAHGEPTPGTLILTLTDALNRGLHYNLGALSQTAASRQAEGARTIARSQLLPSLNGAISEEFERLNLRTMGVESPTFPTAVTFNFYDARAVRLNQSVFDLVRIENLHGASEESKASLQMAHDARDLVVLAVGGAYLQLIATQARISSAEAQVKTSRAIHEQAADRVTAGVSPRIDETRSRVQMQTEEQRLRSLQADLDTGKLRLARIIGLPVQQAFAVGDAYQYTALANLNEETALARAMDARSDLKAAAAGVKAAEASVRAARAERLPSLTVAGDFGVAGRTPSSHSTSVYSAYGTLTLPLYEGGRIRGDIQQAAAVLTQRKAELDDLRGQVAQDIHQAFIDLNAAADQVGVARSNVDLSHQTLEQSRDRFAAGVTDTVEVVQAEQASVQADDDYITAVFQHNLAKVTLARAMGNAEQSLPQLLVK